MGCRLSLSSIHMDIVTNTGGREFEIHYHLIYELGKIMSNSTYCVKIYIYERKIIYNFKLLFIL